VISLDTNVLSELFQLDASDRLQPGSNGFGEVARKLFACGERRP
jgi:hypothetical protein